MAKIKPALVKGTRDFSPEVVRKRQYILNTIREVSELFGFVPIETPAMENLETLEGKYGEEGNKLLFRIINSGDFLAKANEQALQKKESTTVLRQLTEKGLRYDLTIPFARYVVMNQHEITFPFRRYQMQPVWRADRPQKGRYREFWQCDADIIGSDSLLNEVELAQIYLTAFERLGVDVTLRLNNRKVLEGIAEKANAKDKFTDLTIALDKLDKIGWDKVKDELAGRGFSDDALQNIGQLVKDKDTGLKAVDAAVQGSETGTDGATALQYILDQLQDEYQAKVKIDITLARGLDYYTGTIFEVTANGVQIGSVGGGGRYDNLTGMFGLEGVSGVGISFGLDRIYDVMEELNLFPEIGATSSRLLFITFDENSEKAAFQWLQQVRKAGIPAELLPHTEKLKKQMKYANNNHIPFVALVGPEEVEQQKPAVKNMATGEQQNITISELIDKLK